MIRTPAIKTAEIIKFAPNLVAFLSPYFQEAERNDNPRGLHILYVDDSRGKKNPTAGPHVALKLLKEMGPLLGGYRGRLTLFEKVDDSRVLSNELIRQVPPHELSYYAGRLPSEQADLGVCIYAQLNSHELNGFLRDGVREGGFALIQTAFNVPADFENLREASLELFLGSSSRTSRTALYKRI